MEGLSSSIDASGSHISNQVSLCDSIPNSYGMEQCTSGTMDNPTCFPILEDESMASLDTGEYPSACLEGSTSSAMEENISSPSSEIREEPSSNPVISDDVSSQSIDSQDGVIGLFVDVDPSNVFAQSAYEMPIVNDMDVFCGEEIEVGEPSKWKPNTRPKRLKKPGFRSKWAENRKLENYNFNKWINEVYLNDKEKDSIKWTKKKKKNVVKKRRQKRDSDSKLPNEKYENNDVIFLVSDDSNCPKKNVQNIDDANEVDMLGDESLGDLPETNLLGNEPASKPSNISSTKSKATSKKENKFNVTCKACTEMFPSRASLCKHIQVVHKFADSKYHCDLCSLVFGKFCNLIRHMRAIHFGRRYSCNECDKSFTINKTLKDHVKSVHQLIKFKCVSCEKSFNSSTALSLHNIKIHKKNLAIKCKYCDTTYMKKDSIVRHTYVEHFDKVAVKTSASMPGDNISKNQCRFCHKTLGCGRLLYKHQLSIDCSDCLKTFRCKSTMLTHYYGNHSVTCECGQILPNRVDLFKHRQNHSIQLKKYEYTSKKPRFKCPHCPSTFAFKHQFEPHLAKHTGVRPYNCHICNTSFTAAFNLKGHIKAVHTDRNFECTDCKKKFVDKFKLKQHIRIHTGERPFLCHICQKAFTIKASVGTHIKSVHGVYEEVEMEDGTKQKQLIKHRRAPRTNSTNKKIIR